MKSCWSRRVIVAIPVAALAVAASSPPSLGQTSAPATRPARLTHRELFERHGGKPLTPEKRVSAEGTPLTEEENAQVEQALKLLARAIELRGKGRHAEALEAARGATDLFVRYITPAYHAAVTAGIEVKEIEEIVNLEKAKKEDLVEADRQEFAAQAAYDEGRYAAGAEAAGRAEQLREKHLGKEHSSLADSLRLLGAAQTELRAWSSAKQNLSRAVKLSEAAYGRAHPKTGLALDRLGWLQIQTRDYREAVDTLRRATRVLTKARGDCLESAMAMDNLGTALELAGEPDLALSGKLQALNIRLKTGGPRSRDVGFSLSNLAWLYERNGMPEEVIPLRQQALEALATALGPAHPYTQQEVYNLGVSYVMRGKFEEAARLCEQAVAQDDRRPDFVDAGVVERARRLGTIYLRMDRRAQGEQVLKKAVEKALALEAGGDVADAIQQLQQIAQIYLKYRLLDDALAVCLRIHDLEGRVNSQATIERVARLSLLGDLLLLHGRAREAAAIFTEAEKDARKVYASDDVYVGAVLSGLAEALAESGALGQAESVGDQLLKMTDQQQKEEHAAGRGFALRTLGKIYRRQKRYDLAAFFLEDAEKFFAQNQGIDRAERVDTLLEIADCHRDRGQMEECEKTLRGALEECRRILVPDQRDWGLALLARCLKRFVDILPPERQDEKERLVQELRKTLESLRDRHALSAENRRWMMELQIPTEPAGRGG